jgi:hypothetical protein
MIRDFNVYGYGQRREKENDAEGMDNRRGGRVTGKPAL